MVILPKAYLSSSCFIDNVIIQVDILLVVVGIDSCSSNVSKLLNIFLNSINCSIHIKSHLFYHILTLVKDHRCDFTISVEDIIEDCVNGILDGVSAEIVQYSDVLFLNSCDDFLS